MTKNENDRDWFYDTKWIPSSAPVNTPSEIPSLWIIFEDFEDELTKVLRQKLIGSQNDVITVSPGKEFQKLNESHFTVNPNSSKDFIKLLDEMPHINRLAGIIFMWGRSGLQSNPTLSTIESFFKVNWGGFVNAVNAFAMSYLPVFPRLWVVNTSIPSDGDEKSLVLTSLSALCKVAREEYPRSQCSHIALDPNNSPKQNCDILLNELNIQTNEPVIAWRHGKRLVNRLTPISIETSEIPQFSAEGVYLIGGGLRPLGLKLAKWSILHGAKNIVLIDEFEITPSIQHAVAALEALGAEVRVFPNTEHLETIKSENIKGVINSAGVVDNELLRDMNWERFANVYQLKVRLTWILHELTLGHKLDHFILFSSCIKDLAPHSRSSNIAGNSFLNGLAYYRQKKGLTALTINWGTWDVRGLIIRHNIDNPLQPLQKSIEIDKGIKLLETFFYIDKPELMVFKVDWDAFFREMRIPNPFFNEIASLNGINTDKFSKNKLSMDYNRLEDQPL